MPDMSSSSPVPAAAATDIPSSMERAILNYIARKLSSLSESDISLLSDDAIVKLVDTEYSGKSQDDLKHIFQAEVSFVKVVVENIMPPLIQGFIQGVLEGIFPAPIPDIIHGATVMTCVGTVFFLFIVWWDKILTITFNALRENYEAQMKYSKRSKSKFLSKYSTTPDKGLKGIGENDTSMRQVIPKVIQQKKKVRLLIPESPKIYSEAKEELEEVMEAREAGIACI